MGNIPHQSTSPLCASPQPTSSSPPAQHYSSQQHTHPSYPVTPTSPTPHTSQNQNTNLPVHKHTTSSPKSNPPIVLHKLAETLSPAPRCRINLRRTQPGSP